MNNRDFKRRDVLRGTGAFVALAPMGALTVGSAPARAQFVAQFPEQEFALRRELERGLGDGNAIIVTRTWHCRFDSLGAGARVLGEQVSVDVDTPPILAQLAELEKRRKITQFLPASLDSTGRIVGSGEDGGDEQSVTSAARTAADLFAKMPPSVSVSEAREFLSAVSKTAANLVSRVPPDLFFPASGSSSERRSVPLPDGSTGEIEVSTRADTHAHSGLLDVSERTVITRVASIERVSRERWSLTLR